MLRLLIYNTECVTYNKHGRVRSETRISSSMWKCVSAFFMKLVSSGLIMAWGQSQGFAVRMLMPLMYFYFMSIFYFISQSLSFYVIICNRNSIEVSRWEAVCRSEGQAFNFFFFVEPLSHVCGLQPQTLYDKTLSNIPHVFIARSPKPSVRFSCAFKGFSSDACCMSCPCPSFLFNDLSEIFWMIRINRAIRA